MKIVNTISEARSQSYTVPKYLDDQTDVYNFDGYAIAAELGLDLQVWGAEQLQRFAKSGGWDLDELEIRLMLFYLGRLLHFTGYTYHEYDREKDSLLARLAKIKGTDYTPLS